MSKTQQGERAESWPGTDQIPRKAYSHEVIRCGFWLLNEDVRQARSSEQVLLDFFHSTYEAGATLAYWDRESLERHPATHTGGRP